MPSKSKLELLDERIEALFRAKGLRIKPWECPPWWADDTGPPPEWSTPSWRESWLKAQRLRRQLIAEIDAGK